MYDFRTFYIDGKWVAPVEPRELPVEDPATAEEAGRISLGQAADVDRAMAAARRAFAAYSVTSRHERVELLGAILAAYKERYAEIAEAITAEMGAPKLASDSQAGCVVAHIATTLEVLRNYEFEHDIGGTRIVREPMGVCALITPWNWPINQTACKVIPALATGCTMVLKPSEIAPLNAYLLAEVLDEAGVPAGVFNLVDGDGPAVGSAIAWHPEVDMVSFTGSTRAGILVAKNAADTVKRVSQELGGKSANILLDDADFRKAVSHGVIGCFSNTGQSCNAPTRMLVPDECTRKWWNRRATAAKVVTAIRDAGHHDGAGGERRAMEQDPEADTDRHRRGRRARLRWHRQPDGLERGYYVRPTVFADVDPQMTIAREEIFGPVLSILPYSDEADAIRLANDTLYGLSAYVTCSYPPAPAGRRGHSGRDGPSQWRVDDLRAVRRLQAIRQRSRVGCARYR